jgi:hypothetical protein
MRARSHGARRHGTLAKLVCCRSGGAVEAQSVEAQFVERCNEKRCNEKRRCEQRFS